MPINNGITRSIFGRFTTTFAVLALIGATMAAQAGAQDAAATCNGLPATHVITELNEPAAATDGDDVVILDVSVDEEFDLAVDLPLYLTLKGDDTVCIRGDAFVYLFTGSGADTIIVESDVVQTSIWAGADDDTISSTGGGFTASGEGGDDTIAGGAGPNRLNGGSGNDVISGGEFQDFLSGDAGDDIVRGGGDSDTLDGGLGNDMLYGGYGDDFIDGGEGDDSIFGSRGNDELRGNLGADTIYGGPGNDNLSSNVNRDMNPHAATNEWEIDTAGARMYGGEGDDMLWGSNRWDRMQGGPGNDILAGFEGRDYLRGGPGNDQLIGGTNIDDMNGNTGADRIFIQDADKAQGGFGNDECGGFTWEDITIPASCETEFSTTMAMINMNMMNGGGD